MKYAIIIGAVLIVTLGTILFITFRKKKSSMPSNQNALAELDQLKSRGLITEQEYTEKKAEILSRGGGNNE